MVCFVISYPILQKKSNGVWLRVQCKTDSPVLQEILIY
jgi:hypothetical protein